MRLLCALKSSTLQEQRPVCDIYMKRPLGSKGTTSEGVNRYNTKSASKRLEDGEGVWGGGDEGGGKDVETCLGLYNMHVERRLYFEP